MKDTELRGILLQEYYRKRRDGAFSWFDYRNEPEFKGFPIADEDLLRICEQLGENNLIHWRPLLDSTGKAADGDGKISAFGIDVIEGTAQSPISITLDYCQTVNITGSNNIVGDHNLLNVETIDAAISQSNFSEAEKAEAKSRWQKVSENKLLNTIIGSAVGELTKAALPK